jgi:hypothetical protein
MALVNGYLAFRYITDKEPCLREFTNSVVLAVCARWTAGRGLPLRRRRGARGRRLWNRRWLDLILMTCPMLCSTGELEA